MTEDNGVNKLKEGIFVPMRRNQTFDPTMKRKEMEENKIWNGKKNTLEITCNTERGK